MELTQNQQEQYHTQFTEEPSDDVPEICGTHTYTDNISHKLKYCFCVIVYDIYLGPPDIPQLFIENEVILTFE